MAISAVIKGGLSGTGGVTLTLDPSMFMVFNDVAITYEEPADIQLPPSGGSYTNCSRSTSIILNLTNPAADSTFIFPVQYKVTGDSTWYDSAYGITGTLYHSLGSTNISINLVKTTLEVSTNDLYGLCTSASKNIYAEFCPSGSAPYALGDYRWYSHTTPGGCLLREYPSDLTVAYKGSGTVIGFVSRVFKELTNKPYEYTRISIYDDSSVLKGSSSTVDMRVATSPTNHGFHYSLSVSNPNIRGSSTSTPTWSVKSEHFYNSAWVVGNSTTFTLTLLGDPYNFVINSNSVVGGGKSLDVYYGAIGDGPQPNINIRVIIYDVDGIGGDLIGAETGFVSAGTPYDENEYYYNTGDLSTQLSDLGLTDVPTGKSFIIQVYFTSWETASSSSITA